MKPAKLVAITIGLLGCQDLDPNTNTVGPGGKADGWGHYEVYCEPDSEVCIVQGDVPLVGEEAVQAYYGSGAGALTVFRDEGVDLLWNKLDRYDLTYCVSSTEFSAEQHRQLVEDFAAATAEWEQLAHVDFRHVAAEDANCVVGNRRVRFPVLGAPNLAPYIARAFFPYYGESEAAVRVSFPEVEYLLEGYPEASLRGILRHEIGHILGFRHEHIRPENHASGCWEDDGFRPITEYDKRSTMHYPHCDGEGDWSLRLSELDAVGAAFFYPDWSKYRGDRCPGGELLANGTVDPSCQPVVHELLELANTASLDVLDNWVVLDRRAAEGIVALRTATPFTRLEALAAVSYIGPVSLRRMYDYLYVRGRCPAETDVNGLVDARCRPVVHRILELANTASLEVLDAVVRLDSRAASNIVTTRQQRPFTSLVELWAVPYVKTTALKRMYGYLY